MTETVTIPKAEYQRRCGVEEDLADVQAALAVQERIDAGTEEFLPEVVAEQLIDGEPALRVWREHSGLSQAALARAADASRVQIVDIEAGRRTGSVRTLRRLADALTTVYALPRASRKTPNGRSPRPRARPTLPRLLRRRRFE